MSEIQILNQFKNSLTSFFDELIELFPREADLIMIRIFLKDQINIKDVMDVFYYNLNKNEQELKKMIKDKNESFFLENSLFDYFGKSKVLHFKHLWNSPVLDEENKIMVWKWVDSFVLMSEKYNKQLRCPSTD
jgi:hypothetical protein